MVTFVCFWLNIRVTVEDSLRERFIIFFPNVFPNLTGRPPEIEVHQNN